MLPYPINLLGWGEAESGDVVTRDGEYLGRWHADLEGHPGFIPDGHSVIVFYDMFLGHFCQSIREWVEMTPQDREKVLEASLLRQEQHPEEAAYVLRPGD